MRRRHLLGLTASAAAAAALGGIRPARAGAPPAPWRPHRPVRLVVPVSAGGSQDAVARILAGPMGEALGQRVVVENLPGAAGNLGFEMVARARPDGLTLLAGSDGLSINKTLFPRLGFDPVEGFAPVAWVVRVPQILVVRADHPAAAGGLAALLEAARREPPAVGTTGVGSLAHLLGEVVQEEAGVRWLHVPYRGGAPAVNDLVGGTLDAAMLNIGAAAGLVRQGVLRGLFVSSAGRVAAVPEVPTLAECGLGGCGEVVGWHGVVAPAGTDPAALAALHAAVRHALARPGMAARLAALGLDPVEEPPGRLAETMRADADRWGAVIRRARIVPA
jgi:tripartite-type tricarboxylate transporter receptor subunit TctC